MTKENTKPAKSKAEKKNEDGFAPGQVLSFEQITAAKSAAAKKITKE